MNDGIEVGVKSKEESATAVLTPVHEYYPFKGAGVAGTTNLTPDTAVSSWIAEAEAANKQREVNDLNMISFSFLLFMSIMWLK